MRNRGGHDNARGTGSRRLIGIDISPDLIELARKTSSGKPVSRQSLSLVRLIRQDCRRESVDVVFIHAILHHLDLEQQGGRCCECSSREGR